MKTGFIKGLKIVLLVLACNSGIKTQLPHTLKISENGRFMVSPGGDPFFWLGDTGWLLITKLDRKEAEEYLSDRQQKGFNVIQAMLLHDIKNCTNSYGDSALIHYSVDHPFVTEGKSADVPRQYDYWDHVEYIIDLARQKGLYLALVPVWGSNVRNGMVTLQQAEKYSHWLAERFGEKQNIIWLIGGDAKGSDSTRIWNAIGTILHQSCPEHLISFHPFGRTQSSTWFHNEPWVSFNMFQSGHRRYDQDTIGLCYGEDNYKYVHRDYSLLPVKPTLDSEPSYEGIPQGLHDPAQPRWTDSDIRRYAYWSVFAGACGFTYGHNSVMQFHKATDRNPAYGVRENWKVALNAPGASQMIYLKQLMCSRSYFDRVPAQEIIQKHQGEKYNYIAATRGNTYAFLYTFNGRKLYVNFSELPFKRVKAAWYNPRKGRYSEQSIYKAEGIVCFDPPGELSEGNDWVLVLDSF